jgi:hypothetical protein
MKYRKSKTHDLFKNILEYRSVFTCGEGTVRVYVPMCTRRNVKRAIVQDWKYGYISFHFDDADWNGVDA